jgi:hypothetical protein
MLTNEQLDTLSEAKAILTEINCSPDSLEYMEGWRHGRLEAWADMAAQTLGRVLWTLTESQNRPGG